MKIMKLLFIILPIIFLSCAVQGPPIGGEINNEGPRIIDILPFNNKTNLKSDEAITIYFNQMINPKSTKMAFNVFPKIDIIINAKGNKIEIKPKIKWPDSQFSIIGSRSIENHYGKKLSEAISLSFTTNSELILSEISGKLFNYDSTKIYDIGLFEKDKLDGNLELRYKTEQSSDGEFIFHNIEMKNYVLIALESKINNIYSDIRKNRYSVLLLNDINNNNKSKNNYLYIYDKAELLKLKSLDIANKFYGKIVLSNGDSKPFISNNDYFDDLLDDNNSFIKLEYPENYDSILVTIPIENNVETYYPQATFSLNKNIIDTIVPKIDYKELKNSNLYVYFTEPIMINKKQNDIFYSINNDSKTILDFKYINPMLLKIYNFDTKTKSIKINNTSITDMVNNTLNDTMIMIDDLRLSESFIGGNINGEIIYKGQKDIIVELYNEVDKYQFSSYDNSFRFDNIKPGQYNMWAYENINKKQNNYFNGTLSPIKNSAKFYIYNNHIEIRSNWDIEGLIIKID